MIHEGQKVAYAGDDPMQVVGSIGRALVVAGSAAHVQWESGPRTGAVELIDCDDLVTHGSAMNLPEVSEFDSFEASVGVPDHFSMQVRAAFDGGGEDGVLAALSESGHLAMLAPEAEDAILMLGTRIRCDAHIAPLLSHLEVDEQDVVVDKIAATLLFDRLKEA